MNKLVSKIRENTNNIYITDIITRLSHISQNKRYNQIRNVFLNNDPLLDFNGYLEIVESLREELEAGEIRPHYVGCENEAYGHYSAIREYCGYHKGLKGMIMEHGVNFSVAIPLKVNLDETFALFFQSNYKNKKIHEIDPGKLVFCIGPYIHYAAPLYYEKKLCKIKEKLGRIVLIYLSHSTYKENVLRNYNAYREYADMYSEKYDTILFCVYWRDVTNEMVAAVKSIPNAKIVSAGFIYDPTFIRRTKSMLQMADLVVVDEIGTSVGYALYMNKKVEVIRNKDSRNLDYSDSQTIVCLNNQERVENALKSGDAGEINKVYEEFWGGRCIKTRKEMGLILEGLDEILKKSKGKRNRFSQAVEALLSEWENNEESYAKYKLFQSALNNE